MIALGRGLLFGLVIVSLGACQARESNEPIVAAVALNDQIRVRQYLAEGGDPNFVSRDGDPLIYVAAGPRGGANVLQLLILAGADVDARSPEGRTALQNAASWCDAEVAGLLLLAGADVNMAGKDNERALDVVCAKPPERRAETLRVLEAAGAIGG